MSSTANRTSGAKLNTTSSFYMLTQMKIFGNFGFRPQKKISTKKLEFFFLRKSSQHWPNMTKTHYLPVSDDLRCSTGRNLPFSQQSSQFVWSRPTIIFKSKFCEISRVEFFFLSCFSNCFEVPENTIAILLSRNLNARP